MGLWDDFVNALIVSGGGLDPGGGGFAPITPTTLDAAERLRSGQKAPKKPGEPSPEDRAKAILDAALAVSPRTLTEGQRRLTIADISKMLRAGTSQEDIVTDAIRRLEAIPIPPGTEPPGPEGLPPGWTISEQAGKRVLVPPVGSGYSPVVIDARTAMDDRRDEASIAASNAQAGAAGAAAAASNVQRQIYQNKLDTLLKIQSGEIQPPPGFAFDPEGNLVDTTGASLNEGKLKALEAIKSGAIVPPDGYKYNPVTGALEDVSSVALRQRELDIQSRGVEQTGRFQQGQLENERTRLGYEGERVGIEKGRLDIEAARAQSDALAQQQQNLLRLQDFRTKVLSEAPDFIARASMQRGQESPTTPISPADLLNQLANEYNALKPGQILSGPVTNTAAGFGAPAAPLGAPTATPALAQGGTVNDRLMIVGDTQGPHQGPGNPEYVMNPTGAPIAVVPMNKMPGRLQPQGYANGTGGQQEVDPETKATQQKAQAIGRLLQHVDNPDTQHALVDELAGYKKRLTGGVPAYANGTDGDEQKRNSDYEFWLRGLTAGMERVAQGLPMPAPPTQGGQSTVQWWNGILSAYERAAPEVPAYAEGTGVSPTYYFGSQPISGAGIWGATPSAPLPSGVSTNSPSSGITFAASSTNTTDNPSAGPNIPLSGYSDASGKPLDFSYLNNAGADVKNMALSALAQSRRLQSATTPDLQQTTQAEIEQRAEAVLPPAIRQLFGDNFGKRLAYTNTTPNPREPGGITPLRFQFPLFTPQQLSLLTEDELQALNSYLGVKYNTTLKDVLAAQQQTFGASSSAPRRGRLTLQ